MLRRISRQRVLEEMPVGSAFLFANGQYGSGVYIRRSASISGGNPFLSKVIFNVFGTCAVKGKLQS